MGYTALIVDDEVEWPRFYSRILPEELIADIQIASTSIQAAAALRRRRFDIVLLDLVMDPGNHKDRSNLEIQKYLANSPEGMKYIVVSGMAGREDARDALCDYGAAAIVFKDELSDNPGKLARTIETVLGRLPGNLAAKRAHEAGLALVGGALAEHELLRSLPIGGPRDLYALVERLARDIAPIAHHRTRASLEPTVDGAVGLFWSRGLGYPIALSLAPASVPEARLAEKLSAWLGFEPPKVQEEFTFANRIRVKMFRLDLGSESEGLYDLPTIRV